MCRPLGSGGKLWGPQGLQSGPRSPRIGMRGGGPRGLRSGGKPREGATRSGGGGRIVPGRLDPPRRGRGGRVFTGRPGRGTQHAHGSRGPQAGRMETRAPPERKTAHNPSSRRGGGRGRGTPRPAARARGAHQRHREEPPSKHHRDPPGRRGPGQGRAPPPPSRAHKPRVIRRGGDRPRAPTVRGQSQGKGGGDPPVRQHELPEHGMPYQEGGTPHVSRKTREQGTDCARLRRAGQAQRTGGTPP